ncbi:MAG: hypothetical protein IPI30_12750 [Saprospiraceae bacterium]|nr:hypothetical protein [Candidatus Vicinibacter affinis]
MNRALFSYFYEANSLSPILPGTLLNAGIGFLILVARFTILLKASAIQFKM